MRLNGRLLRVKAYLSEIKMLNVLTPILCFLDPRLPVPPLSFIAILQKPSLALAQEPVSSREMIAGGAAQAVRQ
jgi:hypothetical protein